MSCDCYFILHRSNASIPVVALQWKVIYIGVALPLLHREAASNHRESLNDVTSSNIKQQLQLIIHNWMPDIVNLQSFK